MQAKLIAIPGATPAVIEPIAPDRVVEGAPTSELINAYEADEKTFVGEWAATPGAWIVRYDEWEFCHVLSGVCELVPDGGEAQRFTAGDSFVIEPGFAGRLARAGDHAQALCHPPVDLPSLVRGLAELEQFFSLSRVSSGKSAP